MTHPISKTLSFCVALLVSLLGLAPSALACKCMQLGVAEGLANAAAVFEGRVSQVEKLLEEGQTETRELRVTLSVVRVWKALGGVAAAP